MTDDDDLSNYPGPDPAMLKYLEREISDIHVSAEIVSQKTGLESKQAFWAMVMLYTHFK